MDGMKSKMQRTTDVPLADALRKVAKRISEDVLMIPKTPA